MQRKAPSAPGHVVAEIEKNSRERLRVETSTFNGYDLFSLRVWVDGLDGEPKPTQKGVTLRVDLLPQVIAALQKAASSAGKA